MLAGALARVDAGAFADLIVAAEKAALPAAEKERGTPVNTAAVVLPAVAAVLTTRRFHRLFHLEMLLQCLKYGRQVVVGNQQGDVYLRGGDEPDISILLAD